MGGVSKTQQDVLTLVSAALFHTQVNIPEADWKAIFLEAKQQSVVPIVFSAAEPYIPKEGLGYWKTYANKCLANNMQVEWEHGQLHELMTASDMLYVVLKGSASAAYYDEPILRTMGDVDFLVKPEDIDRADKVLKTAGFIPATDKCSHHITYHRSSGDSGAAWELHWEPGGLPDSAEGDMLREQFLNLVDEAELRQTSNGQYMVPTAFHHGLIILLHTAHHMINTGVGLRHLCDWAVFINGLSDDDFAELFEEKLRSAGLWRFTQLLTAVASKYLHCKDRPWAATADETLLEDMISDVFAGGNFGQKDFERVNESKLMTDRSKGTVDDTGFFRQLCNSMNTASRVHFPVTKRHPVLLPVGWVYVGGRYILRILAGKRPKIHLNKALKGAAARKKIYKEFHLFEAEK